VCRTRYFAYTALLVWTFISNAVLSSSYSIVINAQIITRYIFRSANPGGTVGVRLVDLSIASLSSWVDDLLPGAAKLGI